MFTKGVGDHMGHGWSGSGRAKPPAPGPGGVQWMIALQKPSEREIATEFLRRLR